MQPLPLPTVHGSGCTLASLIAGQLALGKDPRPDRDALVSAIRWAKRTHHAALGRAVNVGDGMRALVF